MGKVAKLMESNNIQEKIRKVMSLSGITFTQTPKKLSTEEALVVLNLNIEIKDMEIAETYEGIILAAAESQERCSKCTIPADEAINCSKMGIEFVNGRIYQKASLCNKAKAYLSALQMGKVMEATGLGKRFAQRLFSTFNLTSENKPAYDFCRIFCDNYKADSRGLILSGSYGTGKTHLAAAIINELLKTKNVVGAFVVVPDLLKAIRKSFDEKDNKDIKQLFDTVKKSELLVLDDLGSEKSSDWVREQLFILINSRYENMLPTIITTNLSMSELAEENVLGRRIVSRLCEMTSGVIVKAGDYRLKSLAGDRA